MPPTKQTELHNKTSLMGIPVIALMIFLLLTAGYSGFMLPGTLDAWGAQKMFDNRPFGALVVLYIIMLAGGVLGLHGLAMRKRHAKLAILACLVAQAIWWPVMAKIAGQKLSLSLVISVIPLLFAWYTIRSKAIAERTGVNFLF